MALATLSPSAGDAIVFEVSDGRIRTWSRLRLAADARYTEHNVHLQQPVKEFLGPGLATLDLDVRLDSGRGVNPTDELYLMRAYRDTGEVLTFVVGGELISDFVIESLSETWTRVNTDGVLVAAEVALRLGEYI